MIKSVIISYSLTKDFKALVNIFFINGTKDFCRTN